MPQYPHFFLKETANTSKFTRRKQKIESEFHLPQILDRLKHADALKKQLTNINAESYALKEQRQRMQIDATDGICISFLSEQGFDLKFESLDLRKSGMELLAVTRIDDRWYATVFVPDGKIKLFVKKVEQYATEETSRGKEKKAKHRDLIEGISLIRKATVEALWTDERALFPDENVEAWWEVWLRKGDGLSDQVEVFSQNSRQLGIHVGGRVLQFPERSVIIARATRQQLAQSIDLLNAVAELRKPKSTADLFTGLDRAVQKVIVDTIRARIRPATVDNMAICMLDTGVNREHPLIADHLNQTDMHTIEPIWQVNDHKGHGTEMAGLCIYGDLVNVVESNDEIKINHKIESVKILPPLGFGANDPDLYGEITQEAVARAEITAPHRKRIIASAVTATDSRDNGRPSSWSSAIDSLSCGYQGQPQRLVIISAGNSDIEARITYLDNILTEQIHDPGQAWNALCIGACTDKTTINGDGYDKWQPVAPAGDLSPASTTSCTWQKQWPNKPDVVFEGGNNARSPEGTTLS
jgi:hypothetical protein